MAVPELDQFILPVLECVSERNEIKLADAVECTANKLLLSGNDRTKRTSNNKKTLLYDRTTWAFTHLTKAKLVIRTRLAHYSITDKGKEVLAGANVSKLNLNRDFLKNLKGSRNDKTHTSKRQNSKQALYIKQNRTTTLDEGIQEFQNHIDDKLAEEILAKVHEQPFDFLEKLIIELLVKMNYGEGHVLGRSGDEGVDGVINQDRLGVEKMYVQAKRYASHITVGIGEIHRFLGALEHKKCNKGVFFTTSSYSKNANKVAEETGKITLIDGKHLVKLMIEHHLGCIIEERKLYLRKVDQGYFANESND